MRHGVAGRRLGRSSSHRKAMYRNLVTDLLNYEKVTTTEAKAKEEKKSRSPSPVMGHCRQAKVLNI